MPIHISAGLRQGWLVALVALVIGGIASWFSFLTKDGAVPVAEAGAGFYLPLVVILPLALAIYTAFILSTVEGAATLYNRGNDSNTMMVIAGGGGALLGTLFFFVVVPLGAAAIGGEDMNAIRIALWERIPLWQIALVVIVNTAAALVIGQWAARQSD